VVLTAGGGSILNKRVEFLRNLVLDSIPEICTDRALAITEAYRETVGVPPVLRRALAFDHILQNMNIYILPGELIVGNQAGKPRSAPLFPEFGMDWILNEIDLLPTRTIDKFFITQENKEKIKEIVGYWSGTTHQDIVLEKTKQLLPQELNNAYDVSKYSLNQALSNGCHTSDGDGHIIVDYKEILQKGLNNIIVEAETELASMDMANLPQIEKRLFLKAVIIVSRAVNAFAHRYAEKARSMADDEIGLRKEELIQIAKICDHVPANPARTFWEALQAFWFIHLAIQIESNGASISFGRFDQIVNDFYKNDLSNSKISRDQALELIECFFIKSCELNKVREWVSTEFMSGYSLFQTLTIGGQTAGGDDAANEISSLVLQASSSLKMAQPTTAVRIYSNTSDQFYQDVVNSLIEHKGGIPSFFNDEVAVPLFLNLGQGITLEEAREWAVMGCVEPVIPGRFNTTSGSSCQINLLKVLELTLNDGYNPQTGQRIHPGRGRLSAMKSYDILLIAFKEQIAHYLKYIPLFDAITCSTYSESNPTPFLSSLISGRLEEGRDISSGGGDLYNVAFVEAHGIANVGNSLAAIKKLVFEDKTIEAQQLEKALRNDYQGQERLRQLLINQAPKYGNDLPEVDLIVKDILNFIAKELRSYDPYRGGCFGVSTQTTTSNVPYGRMVGATPDGRLAGEPLADNNSPAPGTDINGPTAAMKSVSRIDHSQLTMGTLYNMKFHPSAVDSDLKKKKFISLLRGYFERKGYQVQFNLVSPEMLKDAQQNPKKYLNLVVKVAGYSARFGDLDRQLQDQLIARTTF
jgi:pyruvate formate-lyase/glycerol dehydratase family glycyl radical enzyme